ncbi:MAG: hypothetical protein MUO64_11100 [Anaerolineales bacterium]|jgi:hypothetical protein|nr:hypothetical protein [Anaerolineales bacterium]
MLSSVGWDMDLSVIWHEDKEGEDTHPTHDLLLDIGTRILALASFETLQKLEKLNGKTERNWFSPSITYSSPRITESQVATLALSKEEKKRNELSPSSI